MQTEELIMCKGKEISQAVVTVCDDESGMNAVAFTERDDAPVIVFEVKGERSQIEVSWNMLDAIMNWAARAKYVYPEIRKQATDYEEE